MGRKKLDADWLAYLASVKAVSSANRFAEATGQEWSESMFLGTHKSNVTDFGGKYVIWSPESSLGINYVYEDRPSAIKVAYEMATKNPSQRFFVMKVVGVAKTQKVEFVDLEKEKETVRVKQPRVAGKFAKF